MACIRANATLEGLTRRQSLRSPDLGASARAPYQTHSPMAAKSWPRNGQRGPAAAPSPEMSFAGVVPHNPQSHAHSKLLMQDKKEAPRGGNPPSAHRKGRPTPGAEAPGWASSLSGRARLVLRARPFGFVALLLFVGGVASRLGLTLNLTASLPRGVYQRVDAAFKRGSLVLARSPESWAVLIDMDIDATERPCSHGRCQPKLSQGTGTMGKGAQLRLPPLVSRVPITTHWSAVSTSAAPVTERLSNV